MIAGRSATAQTVANIRHELGLDQPLLAQFWNYLKGLAEGNLGRSYAQKTDVGALIAARLPATLILMAAGIFVEVVLGLLLGVIAAVRRGGSVDRIVMMASFVGVSAPQFVAALLFLYVFAVTLAWFPMSGFGTLRPCRFARDHARHSRRRLVCPHGPLGNDRRAQSGLCPHRPRQGPVVCRASSFAMRCRMRFCRSLR